jgi:hypothetical protein
MTRSLPTRWKFSDVTGVPVIWMASCAAGIDDRVGARGQAERVSVVTSRLGNVGDGHRDRLGVGQGAVAGLQQVTS